MAGVPTGHVFRVQEWMGHADIQTTMRYLHFAPRDEDAGWSPRRSQSNRCDPRKSHDFQAEVQDVRRWPRDAGLRPTRGIVGGIGCPVSAGNSRGTGHLGRLGQHPVRGVCLRCSGAVATRVPLLQRGPGGIVSDIQLRTHGAPRGCRGGCADGDAPVIGFAAGGSRAPRLSDHRLARLPTHAGRQSEHRLELPKFMDPKVWRRPRGRLDGPRPIGATSDTDGFTVAASACGCDGSGSQL